MPMKPTPRAAPKHARPMWMLPPIPSANIGINILLSFRCSHRLPRLNTVKPAKICVLVMRLLVSVALFIMRANQQREDRGEKHEYKCLNQTDQELHRIKRQRQEPSERGATHRGHRLQHVLTG